MKDYRSFFKKVIKNFSRHRVGKCNICGRLTIFLAVGNEKEIRGDLLCIRCGSFSRKRHVSKVVAELIGNTPYLTKTDYKKFSIYNMNINDSFYKVLRDSNSYVCSELIKGVELGTEIEKSVFCQNVERLTFNDNFFDFVITEDVFEHVRDYKKGFKEIYRVLKPNGYHIFTVPFYFDKTSTVRVDTSSDRDINMLPPEYHGSATGKVLAYRNFGLDLFKFLKSINFETHVDFSDYSYRKYHIYNSYVFISKKCAE